MTRKSNSETSKSSTLKGVDDRHLEHPHSSAVDPAGGEVFDGASNASAAGGGETIQKAEKPTGKSDPDAVGYAVFEDCPDPAEDDPITGDDGVGAVVSDDCDESDDGGSAIGKAATSQRQRATSASGKIGVDTSVGSSMGAAVLPDGRAVGGAKLDDEVREGFGLVFES